MSTFLEDFDLEQSFNKALEILGELLRFLTQSCAEKFLLNPSSKSSSLACSLETSNIVNKQTNLLISLLLAFKPENFGKICTKEGKFSITRLIICENSIFKLIFLAFVNQNIFLFPTFKNCSYEFIKSS